MSETTDQKQASSWSDRRLSEMCARQGSSPTAFGRQADAWRTAANHFMAAHNNHQGGDSDAGERHRSHAFRVLRETGLRVEQAAVSQNVNATGQPEPPSPAEVANRLVSQCTRRELWLRDAAEGGTAQHAAALGGLYGTAELYRRAARAFARREDTCGHTFIQAAEQMLGWYRLRAPWHARSSAPHTPAD